MEYKEIKCQMWSCKYRLINGRCKRTSILIDGNGECLNYRQKEMKKNEN